MPDAVEVYVGLGSNHDPERQLRAAVAALERSFGALRRSSVYRSAAVGAPAPDYLNMCVELRSGTGPDAVKEKLRAIEAAAGRTRSGPLVALDLDLLLHGARVDAQRRLPHPDVLRRAFVLAPLAELAPHLMHPLTGVRLGDAWDALARTGVAIARL